MTSYLKKDTTTSSVRTPWTGEAVVLRRTVPPVLACNGTRLPIADRVRMAGVAGVVAIPMADQVQGHFAGSGVAVPGIPPRGRPVRC